MSEFEKKRFTVQVEGKKRQKTILCRPGTVDAKVVKEVATEPTYDFAKLKEIGFDVKNVVDIGGHIGCFSTKAALFYPECEVISYEPMPFNFPILCMNIKGKPKQYAVNAAVIGSRVVKGLPDSVLAENTGGNKLTYIDDPNNSDNTVKCTKIADIMEEYKASEEEIDVLKLDCEGGEWDIVPHIDFNIVRSLMIEFHPMNNPVLVKRYQELRDLILSHGYTIGYEDQNGFRLPKLFCYRA